MSTPPGDLQAAKKPKAMSSRLLTMKFMQRAAATSPATSNYPSPGHKSQANRWQSQDGDSPSSAKRPRLSGQSGVSDNFSPTSPSDVRAALASVEATRQAALERSWRGGETKWSFALRERGEYQAQDGFRIELLNDQSINAINEDVESIPLWRAEEGQGRKVFGSKRKSKLNVKKPAKKWVKKKAKGDDGETDRSDDSGNSEDSFDLKAQEILKTSYDKPLTRTREMDQRPHRISGGVQNLDRTQCYSCGAFGHLKRDCRNQGLQSHHQPLGNR